MADVIKYLSLAGLSHYDEKIKAWHKAEQAKVAGDVTGLTTKVNTLIGSDPEKSVRTIANEELAAKLIPATAKESLNTLEEIAAWIQAHPDDASAMNAAITALDHQINGEGEATGLVDDVEANANAIEALESWQTGLASSATKSSMEGTVTDAAKVKVTVSTKDGAVSEVSVDTKDIASAAALKVVTDDYLKASHKEALEALIEAEETRATGVEATKVDKVTGKSLVSDTEITKLEGLDDKATTTAAIADAKKAGTDAAAAVETEATRATNAETGLDNRLKVVESLTGASSGDGKSLVDLITEGDAASKTYVDEALGTGLSKTHTVSTAINEAQDAAAADAKTKADTAEKNAKDYADSLANNYDAKGDADAAKSAVIGTDGDTAAANTVFGAKQYADDAVAALAANLVHTVITNDEIDDLFKDSTPTA